MAESGADWTGEERLAADEAPAGSLPRQQWVGSLWVSTETGARLERPRPSPQAQGKL